MTQNHKCPYCLVKEYSKYRSLMAHVASCKHNTKEYYINEEYGALHYSIFINQSKGSIRRKYPNIPKLSDVTAKFPINVNYSNEDWSKQDIIDFIQGYVSMHGVTPTYEYFPMDHKTVIKKFGSIQSAIESSGFKYDITGFSTPTKAKDGITYRSRLEAKFVDNYLFGRYTYKYELPYENHYKFYDFYIVEKDLYIEIDGGLRPNVILEKIEINKKEGKKFMVLTKNTLEKFDEPI